MSVNIGINIQRSPNRINQQLREAGVLGKYPKLLLDFKDEYYLTNGSSKTLANAVTHVRSGNATMTDGYGPELVVNGGFDSDISGWEDTGLVSSYISGGLLGFTSTAAGQGAYQSFSTTTGKTYIATVRLASKTANGNLRVGDGSTPDAGIETVVLTSTGIAEVVFVAESSTSYVYLRAGASGTFEWDSVSVREMPALKWAPHNLLTYSEQFDNAAWSKTSATVTANAAVAPDGTTTADEINFPTSSNVQQTVSSLNTTNTYVFAVWLRVASGTLDFNLGNVNAGSYSTVTVTDEWQLFTVEQTPSATSRFPRITPSSGVSGICYAWGAHLYRSDLGGMVDNPDQPASRASYVPTTSSAKHLSRVGHHVYNGSAWVNEGVLAESESRTNLLTQSNAFTSSPWLQSNSSILASSVITPDGTDDSFKLNDNTVNDEHSRYISYTYTTGLVYTLSIFAKKEELDFLTLGTLNNASQLSIFNLDTGVVDTIASDHDTATIEDVGNGWFRCSTTFTKSASINNFAIFGVSNASGTVNYAGDGSSGIYVYGAMLEQAATPSSYTPTSGSTVTRAAETFTIPSANLPWPEPNYIGSELVTNGTFDGASTANWTAVNATLDATDNELTITDTAGGGYVYQEITTEIGKLYNVSYTTIDARHAYVTIRSGSAVGTVVGSLSGWNGTGPTGDYSYTFVATATTHYLQINDGSSSQIQVTVDNVSVREIDDLSVSIATDGRVTYADGNNAVEARFVYWALDGDNRIQIFLDTSGSIGEIDFYQEASNVADFTESATDALSPDILVPFDIASRHGSTFVNGAVDGVALTANTTPTELPDLSATDLSLAYDYMGTVGTFRVWDRDITDDGLVEATNPSLEPSLSLTFEGTGTNSFVVNDWSE